MPTYHYETLTARLGVDPHYGGIPSRPAPTSGDLVIFGKRMEPCPASDSTPVFYDLGQQFGSGL